MNLEIVRNKLYQKYIAPTENKRDSFIGIEIELPLLNLDKQPVSFEVVHLVTAQFIDKFGFVAEGIDSEGNIYSAKDPITGDILSFDCSYNNLELSLGKGRDIHTLKQRFEKYYSALFELFAQHNHTLTGMGVNPYRIYNNNVPIESERYRMLFHHLSSYKDYSTEPMYFHSYPTYGTFSSASQVQLDVSRENLIKVIRAFSRLEPLKALLFSNSVLLGEHEELLCCRDMFWENSTHGINPHNIGMFDELPESIDELLSYIESTSLYCVERDGVYINFVPTPIMEYFDSDSIHGEYYENGSYHSVDFAPKIDDINYLRTFKFVDLTFRGTVEFRSVCCQPVSDSMTVAAFHLGLMNRLDELDGLLENDHVLYHNGYSATELRKLLVKRERASFVDEDSLYTLAQAVVTLAENGLKERHLGEEIYLQPLFERIERRQNPSQRLLTLKDSGTPLESIIVDYGRL